MSLMSPSKHERIERHIMRQRGAGARAVNAEFGFSFEGFGSSVPATSQETVNASVETEREPPVKRRKVAAADEEAPTTKTKATKTRRRFDADADDVPKQGKRVEAADADDSFVGVRKRRPRVNAKASEAAQIVQANVVEFCAGSDTIDSDKTATRKLGWKRKATKVYAAAAEDAIISEELPQALADTGARAKSKKRAAAKTKKALMDDNAGTEELGRKTETSAAFGPVNEDHAMSHERPTTSQDNQAQPKVKKRATARTKKVVKQTAKGDIEQDAKTAEVMEDQEPALKPKQRAPRKPAKANQERDEASAPDAPVDENVLAQAARKKDAPRHAMMATVTDSERPPSRKLLEPMWLVNVPEEDRLHLQKKDEALAGRGDYYIVDDNDASEALFAARNAAFPGMSPPLKAPARRGQKKGSSSKEQKSAAKTARKRTAAVFRDDDPEDLEAPPPKKTRATARSRTVKQPALESTPPHLERRPLQEANANRSPSPRKSPEKPGPAVDEPEAAAGEGTKRKRKDAESEDVADEKKPRKGRKLHVQPDEPALARGQLGRDVEAQIAMQDFDMADAVVKTVEDAKIPPADISILHPKVKKPPKKKAPSKIPPHPERESRLPAPPPSIALGNAQKEQDEDVDWLFAAPEAKLKVSVQSTKAPSARAKTAGGAVHKTKMADIDLDDLIANVAAFAEVDAAKPGVVGRGVGGVEGTRKRRGR